MEELRSRLTGPEKPNTPTNTPTKSDSLRPNGINGSPPALPEKPSHCVEVQSHVGKGTERRESNVSHGVIVCLWGGRSSENTSIIDAWVLLALFLFFS